MLLSDVADFHFINGPHLVQPISGLGGLDSPEGHDTVDENTPIEEQPRAWWLAKDDGSYEGWEETVSLLNKSFEELGPLDGIMGFSQGACLAGLLASAFEDPKRMPGLQLRQDQKPLRFAIAISGFRSREPRHTQLFAQKIQTPVLCVLGKEDAIVDAGACCSCQRHLSCDALADAITRFAERSQTLTDACAHVRVERHEGGHTTPSQ